MAAKYDVQQVSVDAGADAAGPQRADGRPRGRQVRQRAQLDTSSIQAVKLPNGIVSSLHDFTISAWVNPAATTTWSRIFDFGSGTGVYMFLAASAGSTPRFALTINGNGAAASRSSTRRRRCRSASGRTSRSR